MPSIVVHDLLEDALLDRMVEGGLLERDHIAQTHAWLVVFADVPVLLMVERAVQRP